ncbi:MAG: molybdenum cofactor guanylyltransferase [Planctomycetes bacterium]|nr:molybdenum cofactor guanylyltransferase [Planctomycetota bacterium]
MQFPIKCDGGQWPHTGAVLAGGRSRRMGRPKHALPLPDGRPMIEAVADVMKQVCQQVVVVGSTDALATLQHIDDLRSGHGPLGGIEALLASGVDTQYLVCPCDVPLVTSELLEALTVPSSAAATVLRIDGRSGTEPLPARISTEVLRAVRALLDADQRSVSHLMQSIEIEAIEVPQAWSRYLTNINTPQEYEVLVQRTASQ